MSLFQISLPLQHRVFVIVPFTDRQLFYLFYFRKWKKTVKIKLLVTLADIPDSAKR